MGENERERKERVKKGEKRASEGFLSERKRKIRIIGSLITFSHTPKKRYPTWIIRLS